MTIFLLLARYCWIGCCAVALVQQTRLLFGQSLELGWVEGAVFSGAVFAYNVIRTGPVSRRLAAISGLAAVLCFLNMPAAAQWTALVPAGIWALYYGAHTPGNTGLRSMLMIKPLAIALAWSAVTVLLPLPIELWGTAVVLAIGRASFIAALALAYDLCDREDDRRYGFHTVATRFGKHRTLQAIDAALAVSAACVALNLVFGHYTVAAALALLASLGACAWAVRKVISGVPLLSAQKMLIDGLMVAQFALVFIETSLVPHAAIVA
ncbi:MAG: UbiA family prenyltransferase [Candidatus Hydrogenedentes bacterium]|nr:UbiA family prenyltransferase [Candidatus Hydrogenedentota bacterium]